MKELSIEEKAKRYDKAFKRASNIHKDAVEMENTMLTKTCEVIFPELADSEDEKIRKEILDFISKATGCKRWIAWLEKQKKLTNAEFEQGKNDVLWCIKQAKKSAKDENEMGTCWFAEKWLEKQGESIDKIAQRARTEKQRVLVTESDGVANIDWDTRSIQDVKLLLEYGLDYIKKLEKQGEQKPVE